MNARTYIAIDLKSFYASVECVERGLDPLRANLVVADESRTRKTICLAVTPALKSFGIPGRPRLFEVDRKVKDINAERVKSAPGRRFRDTSSDGVSVRSDSSLALGYMVAPPRMARYMEVSSKIYGIYLRYIAPEDILIYSVDEVFIDATDYLKLYGMDAHSLTVKMIREVLSETGITATAGIGTNLYLAKVAMDIVAKKAEADADGVRIACLDELSYRRQLWGHRPLTDFWRLGRGTAAKLQSAGISTLGQLARCSLDPAWENYFFKLFGVNAELIIDHAWGRETCTMPDIKAYRPSVNSLSVGQVLKEGYNHAKARIILREMTENLVLSMVDKRLTTNQMAIDLGYGSENLDSAAYKGPMKRDFYGRSVPKPAHGSVNLEGHISSTDTIAEAVMDLYERIANPALLIHRLNVTACNVLPEDNLPARQGDLFAPEGDGGRERRRQEAILAIKRKYGLNAILKGMDFEEGATAIERNAQIGGHKA